MKQSTLVSRELRAKGLCKCPSCKETKQLVTSFYKNKAARSGYASHCIICMSQMYKSSKYKKLRNEAYKRNQLKHRDYILRQNFGITLDEYRVKFKQQNGVCAICGGINSDRSLAVDHNHKTGQIRGLLCSRCNPALGFLQENPDRITKILDYMRYYNGLCEN